MLKTFTLVHVAPIPVGHTVELKLVAETSGVNETEAIVTDVDTGIVYACAPHFGGPAGVPGSPRNPSELPMELAANASIGRIVRGKVVACHLYTWMAGGTWRVQTQLVVEST
jgi:hypothetical protein